jgi:phosphoglycerol transferase MdoB-like AlkP superfamily enzyme
MDLLKLGSVVGVTTVYFSIWQLVLMGLGILAALGGLVFLFLRSRKYPVLRNLPKAMAALLAGGILAAAMLLLGNGYGVIWQDMSELVKAYDENGFVYCFSASVVNRGVGSPEEYSDAVVRKIADRIGQRQTPLPETHTPNFVFVQLESFFDVNYLENVTCSQNPVPNVGKLREQGSSGLLSSCGGRWDGE